MVADGGKTDAFYDNAGSLLLRDAGALSQTLALAATAIGLGSCVLGRLGTDVAKAAGFGADWVGVGAVHVSGVRQ